MAFPTFVGHGGAVQESTGTLTVVNSASATNGDYELLVIETQNEAVTLTTTGGFTAVPFDDGSGNGIWPSPNATATLATRLTVFERIFSGQADPVTNDPGNHVIANIFTFRKSSGTWSTLDEVRSTTEGTGWIANQQNADTTSASMSGITTDTADQLIVGITAAAKPDIAGGTTEMGTVTNSNLANITERHDDAAASGNGGWIGVWTGEEATSGQAIGTSTWTKATTSQMAHLVMGLRDAAPGGGSVSGSAASVVNVTNAAEGDVLVSGAGASVVNVTNAAAGTNLVSGSAASVVNVTNAAVGTNLISGSAASVVQATSEAVGTVDDGGVEGSIASVVNVTQAAEGDVLVSATGASTIQLTQTAEGDVLVSGTGASVVNLTQVAEGDVLVSGTGESSIDVASVATGAVAVSGSAASQIAVSQSASGAVTEPPRGTIASIINVLSSATGTTPFIEPVGSPFNAGKLPYPGPLWKRKRMYR